jgi:uncharacterized integral membrane protein
MQAFKIGLWALFTIALVSFSTLVIFYNNEPMTISFASWTSSTYPKWAILLSSVLLGAILASMFFIVRLVVIETKNIRLKRANARLERALSVHLEKSNEGPVIKVSNGGGATLEEEV